MSPMCSKADSSSSGDSAVTVNLHLNEPSTSDLIFFSKINAATKSS